MVEQLEERCMMTGNTIPVTFNIPTDVASRGVWVEASGKLTADYTSKTGVLAAGTVVYYDSSIGDYQNAQGVSQVFFELPGTGSTIDLPNTDITGGQIVIVVGATATTLPTLTYSSNGMSTPTPQTAPDTYFGLFEYAVTGGGLNIDMSEVDEVGFPFTITTDPAGPIPANDGVGITQMRGDLFNLYSSYIASQGRISCRL